MPPGFVFLKIFHVPAHLQYSLIPSDSYNHLPFICAIFIKTKILGHGTIDTKVKGVSAVKKQSLVEKIVSYIEDNLDKDLTLDHISKDLNYSKFYLARVFSDGTDCTLYKYIQGRRLTEAARELAETDKPIVEIAYEARYNSQQAFTLAFHQLYGRTPQEYRRDGIFLPSQSKITFMLSQALKDRRVA